MIQTQKKRSYEIDVMKALLVIGMVFNHAIGLLADKSTRLPSAEFRTLTDLVSFSGFLFCFGYAAWLAYFSGPVKMKRVLPSMLRPWIAYYISALLYVMLVERDTGSRTLTQVLFFGRLVSFSEVLPAFTLVLLSGFLFRQPIAFLLERPRGFLAVIAAFLLTTFIPTGWVTSPFLSLFIGAPRAVGLAFPVVQYFPLFLAGMYFARYQIQPNAWIAVGGIVAFYLFRAFVHDVSRFPPDLVWILGSFFFVLLWFAAARLITRWKSVLPFFASIGANTLFYLLMSNILLFAFRGSLPKLGGAMSFQAMTEVTLAVLATSWFLITIVRHINVEPQRST